MKTKMCAECILDHGNGEDDGEMGAEERALRLLFEWTLRSEGLLLASEEEQQDLIRSIAAEISAAEVRGKRMVQRQGEEPPCGGWISVALGPASEDLLANGYGQISIGFGNKILKA